MVYYCFSEAIHTLANIENSSVSKATFNENLFIFLSDVNPSVKRVCNEKNKRIGQHNFQLKAMKTVDTNSYKFSLKLPTLKN